MDYLYQTLNAQPCSQVIIYFSSLVIQAGLICAQNGEGVCGFAEVYVRLFLHRPGQILRVPGS